MLGYVHSTLVTIPFQAMRNLTARLAYAAIVVAAAWGLPALAGESSYKKCPDDTQTCLNKMVARLQGRGWLGIEYEDEKGPSLWKVTRVVPGSPAEAAGFKAGDVLVSVNGIGFARNTDTRCVTCEGTKDIWKPGRKITYVVRRKANSVKLTPTLAALPSDVMAQMIGMHMLQHVQPEVLPPKK